MAKNPWSTKPWQDTHGQPLSEEALRFASRFWDRRTWESYLESLEKKQGEYLTGFGNLSYANKADSKIPPDELDSGKFPVSNSASLGQLQAALLKLNSNEEKVVHAIFFGEMTQAQAATALRVSTARVHFLLQRALRRLRTELR